MQQVVSRKVDPLEPAVVTIGAIHGGTTHNVIPRTCSMLGTVRAFNDDVRAAMPERIERVLRACCDASGATYDYKYLWRYPVTANDPAQTQYARALAVKTVGESTVVDATALMGAEDFSYFAQRVPACFYTLGCSGDPQTSHPHHSSLFDIDERALPSGVAMMTALGARRDTQRTLARMTAAIPEVVEHPSPAQVLEIITRAVFQAGVKWAQIAEHWDAYREAFAQFDVARVAAFDALDIERVLEHPGILRVAKKTKATVTNAQVAARNRARARQLP